MEDIICPLYRSLLVLCSVRLCHWYEDIIPSKTDVVVHASSVLEASVRSSVPAAGDPERSRT